MRIESFAVEMAGIWSSSSAMPPSFHFLGRDPVDFITPNLAYLLHHQHRRFGIFLRSSLKKLSHLCHAPRMKDVWCKGLYQSKGFDILHSSDNAFVSKFASCVCFYNGGEMRKDLGNEGTSSSETSSRNLVNGRHWTNVLLAINVLTYIAQVTTQGKLFLWGAKVNSLIDKGQLWRLATCSLLHANALHLMVNCYSLNSVGPTMEKISGPSRFLAIYSTSAIASSAMSYWLCKGPAVGASGAIFGLVGSLAVFAMRHRGMVRGAEEDLRHIAQVIFLNMAFGMLSKRIDNWGHLGGLLGGVATSWFLGPAWKYEYRSNDGRIVVVDRAPISYLTKKTKTST